MYSNFSQNLKHEINATKNSYYSKLINDAKGDTSRQWNIVNSLSGNNSKKAVEKVELDSGEVISDPSVVADTINNYLIQVQANQAVNLDVNLNLRQRNASFFIYPTNAHEVSDTIKNFKNKKSSGFDSISILLIKHVSQIVTPVLVKLINLSFCTGFFLRNLNLVSLCQYTKKLHP